MEGGEVYPVLLVLKGARGGCKAGGKNSGLNPGEPSELAVLSGREVCGMRGVAVKCIDITQNADCEGSIPAPD